jgi:hypothetical protein
VGHHIRRVGRRIYGGGFWAAASTREARVDRRLNALTAFFVFVGLFLVWAIFLG